MLGKTHITGALLIGSTGLLIAPQVIVPQIGYYTFGCVLGGLLPDIDSPKSMLSKILLPIHLVLSPFVEHRGFTHTLGCFIGVTTLATIVPVPLHLALGIGLGYLSHLLLDCMTVSGVKLFSPFHGVEVHLGNIKTGSQEEKALNLLMTALLAFTLIKTKSVYITQLKNYFIHTIKYILFEAHAYKID